MAALQVVNWTKSQSGRLGKIRRERVRNGYDPMAHTALDGFSVPSSDTREFVKFAHLVGGRNAAAFRDRIYEYAATEVAQTGAIDVPREQFGRIVLSRGYDPIGRSLGEKVYDAFVESGLGATVDGGVSPSTAPQKAPRAAPSKAPSMAPYEAPSVAPTKAPEPAAEGDVARARATPAQRPRDASARVRTHEAGSRLDRPFHGAMAGGMTSGPDRAGELPDTQDPTPREAPPEHRTANGTAAGKGRGEEPATIALTQATVAEIDATWMQVQRTDVKPTKHTRAECERAVLGLEVLTRRDERGEAVARALRLHPWGRRGAAWLRQVLSLLAAERVWTPRVIEPPASPACTSGPEVHKNASKSGGTQATAAAAHSKPRHVPAERPPETSAPDSDAPNASTQVEESEKSSLARQQIEDDQVLVEEARRHVHLKGFVASAMLVRALTALRGIAGRRVWQGATAQGLLEVPVARRDHAVWWKAVEQCLRAAAAGPPATWLGQEARQRLSADLRWISTDAEIPEVAQRAAQLLEAQASPEAFEGDWCSQADEIIRAAAAAKTPAGSAA